MFFKNFLFIFFLCFSTCVSANTINNISSISIRGIKNVSSTDILNCLHGSENTNKININSIDIIKKLFRTKYFLKLNTIQRNDKLIVAVKEFPIIKKIDIIENDYVQNQYFDSFLKKFHMQENNFFYMFYLKKFLFFLKKKYENEGYFHMTCTVQIIHSLNNTVQLNFIISKGWISKVSNVFITGNNHFFEKRLLRQFTYYNTGSLWNFFFFQKYNSEKLEISLQDLRDFYIRRGYLDFKINHIKQYISQNKKTIDIKIDIDEGSKYRFGNFFVYKPNKIFYFSKIDIFLKSLLQTSYNYHTLSKIKKKINYVFTSFGVSYVKTFLHSEIDRCNKKVSLHILIHLKKQYFINKISFTGNHHVRKKFFKKILYSNKKFYFNKQQIKNICKHLFKIGLFDSIYVVIKKDSYYPYKLNVKYYFEENPNNRKMDIHTNYKLKQGLMLNLLFLEKNFFGTGNTVSIKTLKSFSDTQVHAYVLKPMGLFKNFFLKSDLILNNVKQKYFHSYKYINKFFRFYTSLYTSKFKNKKFSVLYGYENVPIAYSSPHVSLLQYLSLFPKKFLYNTKMSRAFINDFFIKYIFDFNNIKKKNFFKKGVHTKFISKLILPYSDNLYHKIFFSVNQYLPLNKIYNLVLHNYLDLGVGYSLGKHVFPFYENYQLYTKYLNSGFQKNSSGPFAIYFKNQPNNSIDQRNSAEKSLFASTHFTGGNRMIHSNIELLLSNIPILRKLFKCCQAGLFLDTFNIWDSQWKNKLSCMSIQNSVHFNKPHCIYISLGTFFRLLSGFGPVTFTFSLPFPPYPIPGHFLKKFNIHFT